jgi:hypothetical protein
VDHEHAFDALALLGSMDGHDVDFALLARYLGAVRDQCDPCRIAHRDRLVELPATVGGFILLAFTPARNQPRLMEAVRNGEFGPAGTVVVASPTASWGEGTQACAAMPPQERTAALEHATGWFIVAIGLATR